jgi:hypothetical protein
MQLKETIPTEKGDEAAKAVYCKWRRPEGLQIKKTPLDVFGGSRLARVRLAKPSVNIRINAQMRIVQGNLVVG